MEPGQKPKRKLAGKIVLTVLAAVLLLTAAFFGKCMFNERPALRELSAYQSAFPDTVIRAAENGSTEIFPKSPEKAETGIIFYVGAQIRPEAYIPLLARMAEKGCACFIPALSFNIAMFEPNAAEAVMKAHPEINSWVLAGHSLGGLTASGFADDHRDSVDGLVLLAAYTNRDLSDTELPMLAVFGDADGILNRNRYEKRRVWNSSDFEEHSISGGNHSQYGDYGKQPRDNEALISADEQQAQTADIIFDWLILIPDRKCKSEAG